MSTTGKVVIFYSSIGYGHISAAQSIQDEIRRQSPATRVLMQDIRTFMHPVWRRVDERLYWFVANHLPECFESLFRAMQTRGNRVPSLSRLPNDYPEESVLAYLTAQRPDAVLATHYGAAQVLGTLREKGLLSDTRMGWLHTDFFEGYFPRILQSGSTVLFLPTRNWKRAGAQRACRPTRLLPAACRCGFQRDPPTPAVPRSRALGCRWTCRPCC